MGMGGEIEIIIQKFTKFTKQKFQHLFLLTKRYFLKRFWKISKHIRLCFYAYSFLVIFTII